MAKQNKGNYFNKSGRTKKSGSKEQMMFGNGHVILEKEKEKLKNKRKK